MTEIRLVLDFVNVLHVKSEGVITHFLYYTSVTFYFFNFHNAVARNVEHYAKSSFVCHKFFLSDIYSFYKIVADLIEIRDKIFRLKLFSFSRSASADYVHALFFIDKRVVDKGIKPFAVFGFEPHKRVVLIENVAYRRGGETLVKSA